MKHWYEPWKYHYVWTLYIYSSVIGWTFFCKKVIDHHQWMIFSNDQQSLMINSEFGNLAMQFYTLSMIWNDMQFYTSLMICNVIAILSDMQLYTLSSIIQQVLASISRYWPSSLLIKNDAEEWWRKLIGKLMMAIIYNE